MRHSILISIILVFLFACSYKTEKLNGPYLGQTLPGNEPVLFAAGIINTGMPTRDITFTPDGKEIYFCVNIGNSSYSTILFCKETEEGWTNPEVVDFATDPAFIYIEPFISPDGSKFYFVTNKDCDFTPENPFVTDIWVADRENDWWGKPYPMDTTINSEGAEFFPSVTKNGNLYFTREEGREYIFRSEFRNGKYTAAEKLPEQVNGGLARYNASIGKDENFIIVPVFGLPDSKGATDYYISFNDAENGWSELISLGGKINSSSRFEYSAGFSPDGEYFFFMSSKTSAETKKELTFESLKEMHNSPENGNSNIYWMKADFIIDLKTKAVYPDK
ncbi:MAG: PD40 domain-containing protein [Mariniphaga sp.]|nr:PD40 domain-containing protein [Mariniphaga sp.]